MSGERDTRMVREDDVIRVAHMVAAGELTVDEAKALLDEVSEPGRSDD